MFDFSEGGIVPIGGKSPFDAIRRVDESGNEHWLAVELFGLLGYETWRRTKDAVERAKISCKNSGQDVSAHFDDVVQMQQIGDSQAVREVIVDYKMSRYAAYISSMNGDPRKPAVAAAQSYFAVKTFEAEQQPKPQPQTPKQNQYSAIPAHYVDFARLSAETGIEFEVLMDQYRQGNKQKSPLKQPRLSKKRKAKNQIALQLEIEEPAAPVSLDRIHKILLDTEAAKFGMVTPRTACRKTSILRSSGHAQDIFKQMEANGMGTTSLIGKRVVWHP